MELAEILTSEQNEILKNYLQQVDLLTLKKFWIGLIHIVILKPLKISYSIK
jgi:hypothetical protein